MYSFIVPSTRVRGQTVGLTARYLRLRPQTVQVALVGGSLVQDFELSASDAPPSPGDRPRVTDPVREPEPAPRRTQPAAAAVKGAPSVVALDSRVGIASFAPHARTTSRTSTLSCRAKNWW